MKKISLYILLFSLALFSSSCKKSKDFPTVSFQLTEAKIGTLTLQSGVLATDAPYDQSIKLTFSTPLDASTVIESISLKNSSQNIPIQVSLESDNLNVEIKPTTNLDYYTVYTLEITADLEGSDGETFAGASFSFRTKNGTLTIENISINNVPFSLNIHPRNVNYEHVDIAVLFSHPLDTAGAASYFSVAGNTPLSCSFSEGNRKVNITNNAPFQYYRKYLFSISSLLKGQNGYTFPGFSNNFYTSLDSSLKFPIMPDDDLLTLIQHQTFRYFYDFGHPVSGMARERNSSGNVVTTGGSGFGVMALIVGMHRGFITRNQGLTRLDMILSFLESCDRFHGAWPHWLNGNTGAIVPFSSKDNGADLVETSFMVEGLLTMKQYLDPGVPGESDLINRITVLVNAVEWDWFTRGQNVLYWHWSPDQGWVMNMQIKGYNETLITYILAASSTTHTINAGVYNQGFASNGGIINGNSYFGYQLPVGGAYGGPLFFTHYSFLGLDPHNLVDDYANYWTQNVNHSLINYTYCSNNPKHFTGYSPNCWGLTASDNPWGYNAHSPTNDLGVITPSAAVSSLPYSPGPSMNAIRHFYYILGDKLWGQYGFYDAFSPQEAWWADSYLAIDQGPIVCMIENYRSGLLWSLFMSNPEISQGLNKLGFTYKKVNK
ncbi:MAG: glucoamylase family protein [Bacteroidales bacterium]